MLSKYRRGQIRGIDFSLSMIIFLLTMSQILILTSNFIVSNRSFQESIEGTTFAESLSKDILFTSGHDTAGNDWMDISTTNLAGANGWDFGLSSNGEIDPFKIGRLSNWSITDLYLDYNTISQGINLDGKIFSIELKTSIKVNITSITLNPDISAVDVVGEISVDGSTLTDADVRVYGIAAQDNTTVTIVEAGGTTLSSGIFTVTIDMTGTPANTVITIIAIGSYGLSAQGVDVSNYNYGNPTPITPTQLNVKKAATQVQGYSVDVVKETTNPATLYAFYNLGISGGANYTRIDMTTNTAGDFNIPQKGITVFLLHEYNNNNNPATLISYSVLTIPALLDGNIGAIVKPSSIPNAISSVATIPFEIRGIMMNFILTTWG